MSTDVTRRNVLKTAGVAAGAAIVGGSVTGSLITPTVKAETMGTPWPLKKFKVKKVQERAYQSFFTKGGCMVGVLDGLAGLAADKLGAPYTDFPFDIAQFGAGGVSLWGTICGTLNGAAMAISLFVPKSQGGWAIINELMAWYENTKLPIYEPKNPVKVAAGFNMPKTEAENPLCHASVSEWTHKSGFGAFSPERSERCGRLVADVAGKVAEYLNDFRKGKFVAKDQISKEAAYCMACHEQPGGDTLPDEPQILSKMECTTCHEDHTGRFKNSGLRTKY